MTCAATYKRNFLTDNKRKCSLVGKIKYARMKLCSMSRRHNTSTVELDGALQLNNFLNILLLLSLQAISISSSFWVVRIAMTSPRA